MPNETIKEELLKILQEAKNELYSINMDTFAYNPRINELTTKIHELKEQLKQMEEQTNE